MHFGGGRGLNRDDGVGVGNGGQLGTLLQCVGCACHHSLLDLTSCSEPASLFLHLSKVGFSLHNVEDTVTLTSSNTELPVSREEGVRTRAAGDGDDKDGVVGHVEDGEP